MNMQLIKTYLAIIVFHIAEIVANPLNTKLEKALDDLTIKENKLKIRLRNENLSKEDYEELSSKLANVDQAKVAISSFLQKENNRESNEPSEIRTEQLKELINELNIANSNTQKAISKQPNPDVKISLIAQLKIVLSGTARQLKSVLNAVGFELKREERKERMKAHPHPEPTRKSTLRGG